jgi:hypothetical protein
VLGLPDGRRLPSSRRDSFAEADHAAGLPKSARLQTVRIGLLLFAVAAALAASVSASPVVANGVAYAVARDALVAVSAASGERLLTAPLGGPGSSPVVLDGRVYVATAAGELIAFGL